MKFLTGGLAAMAALAIAGSAAAAPVLWAVGSGGNGHYYELVTTSEGNISWEDALDEAETRTHAGLQGYLATVTSAAENAFLVSISNQLAWLGGSDAAVEGTFVWNAGPENGQALTYNNWNGGEPNNFGGEDYIQINWAVTGGWNDAPGTTNSTTSTPRYFVEYGGISAGGIPEPGAWALMIMGFGGAGAMLRRRRTAAIA